MPPGADGINYYFGGTASVDLPDPLPTDYPGNATMMNVTFSHVRIPNAGLDYTNLVVYLFMQTLGVPMFHWEPVAHIITNADAAAFLEDFWSGTWVWLDASLFGPFPPGTGTENIILVDPDVLQVEKHGNRAYVSLNEPQEIDWWGVGVSFILPEFSSELRKLGGSVHRTSTILMEGWPFASGYTMVVEEMGFYANGVFTCEAWGYSAGVPVNDANIVMHGIHTHYPPSPT